MDLESKLREDIEKSDIDFDSLDLRRKTNYSIEWDLITYIRDLKDLDKGVKINSKSKIKTTHELIEEKLKKKEKEDEIRLYESYNQKIIDVFNQYELFTEYVGLLKVKEIRDELYSISKKKIKETQQILIQRNKLEEENIAKKIFKIDSYEDYQLNEEQKKLIEENKKEICKTFEIWKQLIPEEYNL